MNLLCDSHLANLALVANTSFRALWENGVSVSEEEPDSPEELELMDDGRGFCADGTGWERFEVTVDSDPVLVLLPRIGVLVLFGKTSFFG